MPINKNLTPPCLNCSKRHPYCHDTCTAYKQFKENNDNVKAARNEFMNEKNAIVESVRRTKRR